MLHGEYGIDDVCLSLLCIVNHDGIGGKLICPLNDSEVELLRKSAAAIKAVLHNITY